VRIINDDHHIEVRVGGTARVELITQMGSEEEEKIQT
jgi:hypothetical protein